MRFMTVRLRLRPFPAQATPMPTFVPDKVGAFVVQLVVNNGGIQQHSFDRNDYDIELAAIPPHS